MKMPLSEDDVEVAHTLTVRSTVAETASSSPSRHSSPAADNRIDPQYQQTVPQIIDRFKSKGICDNVIRNRSVLKNMNLAIVEDLTALDVKTMNRVKKHPAVQKVWGALIY